MTATVLTWNLERKAPSNSNAAKAIEVLFDQSPDVMVLTEARTNFPTNGGHSLWCEPPRGSTFAEDERKVLIWSKEPWRDIDRIGAEGLDQTRFIAATTDTPIGPLRVLGVCIPWHMAEVQYPIDVKRKPWELHERYLDVFTQLVEAIDGPTVIAGDFNQRIPRQQYGRVSAAEALASTFASVDIVTQGIVDGCGKPGIDHIAISSDLATAKVWGWPNEIDGYRMSDHDGAGAELAL